MAKKLTVNPSTSSRIIPFTYVCDWGNSPSVEYSFRLNSSSLAIDRGTPMSWEGAEKDLDGNVRTGLWDIGAYEFNPETAGCMLQGELNTEIQRFVNGQIDIVPVTNKVIEYLGC